MRYSIELRDQISAKGYEFLNIGKNKSKKVSSKYNE